MSLIGRAFRNQTTDTPITTSHELQAFLDVYGAWSTTSGVAVSPATAMACAAVSAAVGLLSESAGQLPLNIYRRLTPRGKDKAREHPVWSVLHDSPNAWQNPFEYREQKTLHLALWGNAYSIKVRSPRGELMELLPIHPSRVEVKQDERWRVTYKIKGPDDTIATFPRDRVFHIRDRSINGYEGRPRILDGRDTIGLALSAERWGGQLFGNSARPAGLLSTDENLTDDQIDRLISTWKQAHGGSNALGTAVLDGGMKWSPLVMNNTDAQFLETRKFQIAEVARLYRVPPHMLGDLEKATFSNVEHMGIQFVKFTLLPWLKRWESAINDQLLDNDPELFAEFNVNAFERGDLASRTVHYSAGIRDGYYSPNDVLEKENENPVDGGDEYRRAESIHGPTPEGVTPA